MQIQQLLKKQYSQPMTTQERVKGGASALPVIGDAISGYDAYQSAKQGNYGEAALNAIGLLPFIPGLAGVIKSYGDLPKSGLLPDNLDAERLKGFGNLPNSNLYDGVGHVYDDMSIKLSKLNNGDFIAKHEAPRLSKLKNFYAIGDDAEELAKFMLDKKSVREQASNRSAKKAYDNSLIGKLTNEFGDVFSLGGSTQSKSKYITHNPTGTKIRISDHDLPLHYEQPDLNFSDKDSADDILNAFMEYLSR